MWDGHSCHDDTEIVTLLASFGVDQKLFIAYASHIMQPLDLIIFGKFKAALKRLLNKKLCKQVDVHYFDTSQRRELYIKCALSALHEATSADSIQESYTKAVLYPFNSGKALNCSAITETAELTKEYKRIKRQ